MIMRGLAGALLLLLALASPALAQTLTITDPFLRWNNQVMAPVNGVWGTSTGIVKGTYTGVPPTHVACQIYQSDGVTVVQTWTQLTSETIGGSAWKGTLSAPWGGQYKAQCRETNATSITTAVTTNLFGAGPTPVIGGQSQLAHMFNTSARCLTATMNAGSPTVTGIGTCTTILADGTGFNAWKLYSANLPGGVANIISNVAQNSITLDANAIATQTGTADITVEIQIPAVPTLGFRINTPNVAVWPVGDAPHTAGQTTEAVIAHAQGEIALGIAFQTASGGGASMQIEAAQGSTTIAQWSSPSGQRYTATVALLGNNGTKTQDFSDFFFAQGGQDTIPPTGPTDPVVYLAGLRNLEAWVNGFRANVPLFILPVGIIYTSLGTTDAIVDSIRQDHYTAIDNDPNVFFGGLDWDCEHVPSSNALTAVHLSPAGQDNCYTPRIVQAWLRQHGQSTHGYGPKLDPASGKWNGAAQFKVDVVPEAVGDTLTCAGLATTCTALTGFRILDNGAGGAVLTISSTALSQPKTIVLNVSGTPTCPCVLDYGYGANSPATNLVYNNWPVPGDVNGLPLQHSRIPAIAMTNTVLGTGGVGGHRMFR